MTSKFVGSRGMIASASLACAVFAIALVYIPNASHVAAQQAARTASPARAAGGGFSQPDPIDFNDHEGWTQIFDGKTLKGWDGTPDVWHVEDGSIVGVSSTGASFGNDKHHLERRRAGELRSKS